VADFLNINDKAKTMKHSEEMKLPLSIDDDKKYIFDTKRRIFWDESALIVDAQSQNNLTNQSEIRDYRILED
jgi:hypothetical protein